MKRILLIIIPALTPFSLTYAMEEQPSQGEKVQRTPKRQQRLNKKLSRLLPSAIAHCNLPTIKMIVDSGVDVNEITEDALARLLKKSLESDESYDCAFEVIKFLLSKEVNQNIRDILLKRTILYGQNDIASYLIEHGADVNARGDDNLTSLMRAAATGNFDGALILLTTISLQEQKEIQKNLPHLLITLKATKPGMPKDMRWYITQHLVSALVDDHMNRMQGMLNQKIIREGVHPRAAEVTARNYAIEGAKKRVLSLPGHFTKEGIYNGDDEERQEVLELIEQSTPEAQKFLRKIVEENIREILFNRPEQEPIEPKNEKKENV